jgi:hypothetical protein
MAQQQGRTHRLGCLLSVPREANIAFLDELRRRGFIEGQNLTVKFRAYGQHVDLIPQYAAELVNARVDVIVAAGDETRSLGPSSMSQISLKPKPAKSFRSVPGVLRARPKAPGPRPLAPANPDVPAT